MTHSAGIAIPRCSTEPFTEAELDSKWVRQISICEKTTHITLQNSGNQITTALQILLQKESRATGWKPAINNMKQVNDMTYIKSKIADYESAHLYSYSNALAEIKQGRKQTHWMWYIFPQIYGLGESERAIRYAIYDRATAQAFLDSPTLGRNLREICNALMELRGVSAEQVFGGIDARKLRSSMTLFDALCPNDIYAQVLDKYFNGTRDNFTLCRLGLNNQLHDALKFIGVDAGDFNITPNMYNFQRSKPTHRFSHIYRVMIGAALIAKKINEPRLGLLAFIAAFVHDLARQNDGDDPTHGRRAAETKLPLFTHILSKYNISEEEYDMIARAVTYHCERIGERISLECYKVCKILSDADALDRCRFRDSYSSLNRDFLHFPESHKCITPIEFVFKESYRHHKMMTEIPFADFITVTRF